MNNIILTEEVRIEDMIYEVRGVQVMLDSDIAKLYQVETKRINEAVKNNLEKFPERFSWILTENEWIFLRPKISTLIINNYQISFLRRKFYTLEVKKQFAYFANS
jgi:hypothetical protein